MFRYGIWGGGGNPYRQRGERSVVFNPKNSGSPSSPPSPPSPTYISLFVGTTKEKESFEWFRCRTATKLPASFMSEFWTTLLFQASHDEPAILHAVLALSSVHRGGVLDDDNQDSRNNLSNKIEQSTLQHYIKATRALQHNSSSKERKSTRLALIACIVFVSLDFLRGYFTTAQIHLENGLKILGETDLVRYRSDQLLLLGPVRASVDDWIVESFSRLHIQVELFKQPSKDSYLLLQSVNPISPGHIFQSFKEAWRVLEWLMNQALYLNKLARKHQAKFPSIPCPPTMFEHQKRTQTALEHWVISYESSKETLQRNNSADEKKAYPLLHTYHDMVNIMTFTCLCPGDEEVFDSYTYHFANLVSRMSVSFKMRPGLAPMANPFTMGSSIVDMGCMPPLYYVVRLIRFSLYPLKKKSSVKEPPGNVPK